MNLKENLKGLKNAIFEEGPKSQPTESRLPAHSSTPTYTVGEWDLKNPNKPSSVIGADPAASAAYDKLKAKLSFENSPAGIALNKYLTPLLTVPIEEHAKYKAAIAQGQATEGLTADTVIDAFDTLSAQLSEEVKRFREAAASADRSEVGDKTAKIASLDDQITALQVQQKALQNEVAASRAKINQAQQDFTAAADRISQELAREQNRYRQLLKG